MINPQIPAFTSANDMIIDQSTECWALACVQTSDVRIATATDASLLRQTYILNQVVTPIRPTPTREWYVSSELTLKIDVSYRNTAVC